MSTPDPRNLNFARPEVDPWSRGSTRRSTLKKTVEFEYVQRSKMDRTRGDGPLTSPLSQKQQQRMAEGENGGNEDSASEQEKGIRVGGGKEEESGFAPCFVPHSHLVL